MFFGVGRASGGPGREGTERRSPSASSFAMAHRQRERERRACADLALHPDPSAVEFDELPGEGQPEPGAFRLLRRGAYLPKLLEHHGGRIWVKRSEEHTSELQS